MRNLFVPCCITYGIVPCVAQFILRNYAQQIAKDGLVHHRIPDYEVLAPVRQDYAVLYVAPWYYNGAEELIHCILLAGLLLKVIILSRLRQAQPDRSQVFISSSKFP